MATKSPYIHLPPEPWTCAPLCPYEVSGVLTPQLELQPQGWTHRVWLIRLEPFCWLSCKAQLLAKAAAGARQGSAPTGGRQSPTRGT